MSKKLTLILMALGTIIAVATAAYAHHYEAGDLFIDHPWARATPTTADVGGGYMRLVNKGNQKDTLLWVKSPVSDKIEIHEMSMENNVMKMRKLDSLPIAAHSEISLSPDGVHIMFENIKAPFVQGQSFPATLHFERAGDINVEFVIDGMGVKVRSEHHHAHP